ncbi:MAG: glycosyltransferase family 2 protein [Pseudomonadota bacterium]
MTNSPRFSIVVPMKNEVDSVAAMLSEVEAACAPLGPFELIIVDDGSDDGTTDALRAAAEATPWFRTLRHAQSCGQSAAVLTGVRAAHAEVCATLDGDLQNPPAELPKLLAPLLEDETGRLGLVAGQRKIRRDTPSKRLASRLANALRRRILRDDTRDTGCGLKGFRRDVFLALPFFDHIHRYLPALVKREGYAVLLVDVEDRERASGRSKYTNLNRAIVGASDLLGVWWLMRRRALPRIESSDE